MCRSALEEPHLEFGNFWIFLGVFEFSNVFFSSDVGGFGVDVVDGILGELGIFGFGDFGFDYLEVGYGFLDLRCLDYVLFLSHFPLSFWKKMEEKLDLHSLRKVKERHNRSRSVVELHLASCSIKVKHYLSLA